MMMMITPHPQLRLPQLTTLKLRLPQPTTLKLRLPQSTTLLLQPTTLPPWPRLTQLPWKPKNSISTQLVTLVVPLQVTPRPWQWRHRDTEPQRHVEEDTEISGLTVLFSRMISKNLLMIRVVVTVFVYWLLEVTVSASAMPLS